MSGTKTETKSLALPDTASTQIMGSLESLFVEHAEKLAGIQFIANSMNGKDSLLQYFTNGLDRRVSAEELFDLKRAKATLDAESWSQVMKMTDVLECMPAAKRNEWNKTISECKTIAFERDAVVSTIGNMLLSRGNYLSEKVDGVFRNLSGDHITNSPMGFRKRMIIARVLDKFGVCYERSEYVHDLRAIIAKLLNRNEPNSYSTRHDLGNIQRSEEFGEWHEFDGCAFKIRLYKVGTAHIEIHPEIAVKLNLILASLYPQALASSARTISKKEKTIPLMNTILSYAVTGQLSNVADSLGKGRMAYLNKEDMDKKTYKEVEEVLGFLGGVSSKGGGWTFSYDVSEILFKIIRTGCLPEKVSHQFYPTKAMLAERVVKLISPQAGDKILEPSAGHGAIAELLPKELTTCVEVNDLNSAILMKKGLNVITADFLKWEPKQKFNKIAMNPPFAKGEAQRHVKKASELLADNGVLVAILPASLRNKTLVDGMTHTWSEVISDAFDDTGVNVAILELTHSR
jgi:phospholipid N-methyltransferase